MSLDPSSPRFEQLLLWSLQLRLSNRQRYLIASSAVLLAAWLRALFVTGLLPYLFFIPVVLAVTLLLGRGPGVLGALVSAGAAILTFQITLGGVDASRILATILYALVTLFMVFVGGELRHTVGRAHLLAGERDRSDAELNQLRVDADAEQRLLNKELDHRLKNLIMVVQSIASQTLRQASDLSSANRSLNARLAALGGASRILTQTSWRSADLSELAREALLPHDPGDRIAISGPIVQVSERVAMPIVLALHELATNATKYGALSNDSGVVRLAWAVRRNEVGEQRFTLAWRESGGPSVAEPSRRGFGSHLIEQSLRGYLRGQVRARYAVSGLEFDIEAPLSAVVAEPGVA